MKKIDITSITRCSEWGRFKERWIASILNEFSPRVRLDWKVTIREYYAKNIQGMKDLFDMLIDYDGQISVPDELKDSLERGLPTLYTDTLGSESSGLRSSFFQLFSAIEINICPYCNHVELNDVQYEVDHIKDKSTNPLYSLNIHNLILICHGCNQGKSTYSGFCNFYQAEIYSDMMFKIGGKLNDLYNGDITISMETCTAVSEQHMNSLLKPLYLRKGLGIYNDLAGYVKCHLFPERYKVLEGLLLNGGITNGTNSCYISDCYPIHKKRHSKFILDIIDDANYNILEDL